MENSTPETNNEEVKTEQSTPPTVSVGQAPPTNSVTYNPPPPPSATALQGQGLGCVALILGLPLCYIGIYKPLSDAANHTRTVHLSMQAAGIGTVVVLLGLIYLIGGDKTQKFMGDTHAPTTAGKIVYGVLFVIGLIVYFVMEKVLKGYGYGS
jgi:hypothetical protein